ncbi:monocyte to macrophage differentiation factor isoform X1 [Ursus maritimus]|uniref:Monocyte to macrophage differentiation factor isoform X1 n=1 Tax=Ursus maritimus TaxID=29073 RepID=A0A8M1GP14_URSMA|nr:monocyte to macrophage differentiation factor isoform X1 [Ursus maritimus]
MRFKNRFQRFMNHRAPANGRYKPTCYEHAANCYTHAFLIVPAIVGSALLHRLSDDCWEKITAWIYGMGLCALFIVSTVFHIVSWKKSHLRTVEHCFHMCDRMVIYFFIAASYAPWLNLRELGPLASHMRWFIWLMAAGGTIYVFLYHEKYKVVELFFYLTMGFSPALVVTSMGDSYWGQPTCCSDISGNWKTWGPGLPRTSSVHLTSPLSLLHVRNRKTKCIEREASPYGEKKRSPKEGSDHIPGVLARQPDIWSALGEKRPHPHMEIYFCIPNC